MAVLRLTVCHTLYRGSSPPCTISRGLWHRSHLEKTLSKARSTAWVHFTVGCWICHPWEGRATVKWWSLCPFFRSKGKGFSGLGHRNGACSGRGGGERPVSSDAHSSLFFPPSFLCSLSSVDLVCRWCCRSGSDNFCRGHVRAHARWFSGGRYLPRVRGELTLLLDDIYFTLDYNSISRAVFPDHTEGCLTLEHFLLLERCFSAQPHL